MSSLVDYSWARPNLATLKRQGVVGVGRYLTTVLGKVLTLGEAEQIRSAGLDIFLIWEEAANNTLGGATQGVADGHTANALASTLGAPLDVPIYYAVDFDASTAQYGVIASYLEAAKTTGRPVGVYGSIGVVNHMLSIGAAEYGYQTLAWSNGQVSSQAHIYQSALGVSVDNDMTLKAYYGQWGVVPPPSTPVATSKYPIVDGIAHNGGYTLLGSDGGVFAYGDPFEGSLGGEKLNAPAVSMTPTASGNGYLVVGADGGVFSFGDAVFRGSLGGAKLNAPIVAISLLPEGGGYYLVGSDGGVFAYGSATFHGSMAGVHLNAPVVDCVATEKGYYLIGADGGLYCFGDAPFHGSLGGSAINAPIVGMALTASGNGYWLAAADGGVFAYGDAGFYGSLGGIHLAKPVVAIARSTGGAGYYMFASDGGVFTYGDAKFLGSAVS